MAAKEGRPSRVHLNQPLIISGLLPTILVPLRFVRRASMPEHTHSFVQITHIHTHAHGHTHGHSHALCRAT